MLFLQTAAAIPALAAAGDGKETACAEQTGGAYVLARKPNPALVAGSFYTEAFQRETAETVETCLEHRCPYELVLKDISTVRNRPENLIQWVKTVEAALDRHYR